MEVYTVSFMAPLSTPPASSMTAARSLLIDTIKTALDPNSTDRTFEFRLGQTMVVNTSSQQSCRRRLFPQALAFRASRWNLVDSLVYGTDTRGNARTISSCRRTSNVLCQIHVTKWKWFHQWSRVPFGATKIRSSIASLFARHAPHPRALVNRGLTRLTSLGRMEASSCNVHAETACVQCYDDGITCAEASRRCQSWVAAKHHNRRKATGARGADSENVLAKHQHAA